MATDPTSKTLRNLETRLEYLEKPVEAVKSPPAPKPSAEAERTYSENNEKIARYKRGDR